MSTYPEGMLEDAKQTAREGFCRDCNGFGCEEGGDEDNCEGFQKEVQSIIAEWDTDEESGDCMADAKDRRVEQGLQS